MADSVKMRHRVLARLRRARARHRPRVLRPATVERGDADVGLRYPGFPHPSNSRTRTDKNMTGILSMIRS